MPSFTIENFEPEFVFKATRSGGKGGQNVNKVSSKAELYFDLNASNVLSDTQKLIIHKKLASRINKEGILKVEVQSERSQYFNKKLAAEKFIELINNALKERKKRVATKPSKSSKEKRLKTKKLKSDVKQGRKKMY